MTLSTCKKCDVCIHKVYCPVDNQDMFTAMGNIGIENTCVAFKAQKLPESNE